MPGGGNTQINRVNNLVFKWCLWKHCSLTWPKNVWKTLVSEDQERWAFDTPSVSSGQDQIKWKMILNFTVSLHKVSIYLWGWCTTDSFYFYDIRILTIAQNALAWLVSSTREKEIKPEVKWLCVIWETVWPIINHTGWMDEVRHEQKMRSMNKTNGWKGAEG